MLQEDGHEVQLERVRFKAGKSPWVGTRSTYKKIYKFLMATGNGRILLNSVFVAVRGGGLAGML